MSSTAGRTGPSRSALVDCALAGCCGAVAAAFARLGGSCAAAAEAARGRWGPWAPWACRAAGIGLMLAANAVMFARYVACLRRLPSLQVTVLVQGANIVATGLLGHALFGELLTARWLAGVAAVMSGLALICLSAAGPAPEQAAQTAVATPPPTALQQRPGRRKGRAGEAGDAATPAPPQQAGSGRVTRSAARALAQKADTASVEAPSAAAGGAAPGDAGGGGGQGSSGRTGGAAAGAAAPSRAAPKQPQEVGTHSYRMVVAYDGTAYSGWQLQPKAPTIQAQIERALSTVLREARGTLGVSAAGRTDAGVHAAGQVVQFHTNRPDWVDLEKFPARVNSLLPHDIRISWLAATAPDFNVTCSATGKIYHYSIDTGRAHNPLTHRHRMHVPRPLDVPAMRAGAALLVGTHDFTQFSNNAPERLRRNPVKSLWRLDVLEVEGGLRLEVEGSGFLYKQVRHMTGVLLALGEGRLGPDYISERLAVGASRPPGAGGAWRGYNVAPGKGLLLHTVHYPPEVDDPNTWLYPSLPHDEWGRLLARAPGESTDEDGG
ncbi:tRNA pseudouridine synthase A [Raphidocelis subcapitata]|uniref:tRNA pseudouridine synthase A n=1 Tax=Raphidocelis subcapitata TaxID=307507 RepID=A0A2V0NSK2_9CHLO|nr:tRNA pseudouridine synthase A [Raphidocelis subcapitata]|eukprot:GBF88550.1 tRNA pseudouridine synthase A [Raphidocelis subcapitata]